MHLPWGDFDVSGSNRIDETEFACFAFCLISTDLFKSTVQAFVNGLH